MEFNFAGYSLFLFLSKEGGCVSKEEGESSDFILKDLIEKKNQEHHEKIFALEAKVTLDYQNYLVLLIQNQYQVM